MLDTILSGSTPEKVENVVMIICAKFHAFITFWAIFSPKDICTAPNAKSQQAHKENNKIYKIERKIQNTSKQDTKKQL